MNSNLYHYQKQEIVIDKNSPEAVKFYNETVKGYFDYLSKTKITEHLIDEETGERSVNELKVHTDVRTEETDSTITVVSEENWTDLDDFEDHSYNTLNFLVDESLPVDDPRNWQHCEIEHHYVDGIESVEGNTDFFDIDALINAYREQAEVLGDHCRIRVVRGRDLTGYRGSRVFCWSSWTGDEAATASNNDSSSEYGGVVHLNKGRFITPDELPETSWTDLIPVFEILRASGYYLDLDKDPVRGEVIPVSPQLVEEFGKMPDRIREIAENMCFECRVDCSADCLPTDHDLCYLGDLIETYDNSIKDMPTKQLKKELTDFTELIDLINDSNQRFFKAVNFYDDEMIRLQMLFYSKDFALLEVFYDEPNHCLRFKLYDECMEYPKAER